MKKILSLLLLLSLLAGLCACGTTPSVETPATETVETGEYHGELPLVQPGEDNKITIGIHVSPNVTDYNNNAYTRSLQR